MKIAKDAVVSLRVEIIDEAGKGPPAQDLNYLHGGYGNLFPKVEAALAGLEPGASTSVTLSPSEGFGERDSALVVRERRERLPRDLELGSMLRTRAAEDGEDQPVFRVTELSDTEATLDGNHPFAGHTVELRCAVLDVRPASDDERQHGHAHGPDGGHAH
ncbi:MAG: peptidylprolyl isomerase [Burkholderiales bacterium]